MGVNEKLKIIIAILYSFRDNPKTQNLYQTYHESRKFKNTQTYMLYHLMLKKMFQAGIFPSFQSYDDAAADEEESIIFAGGRSSPKNRSSNRSSTRKSATVNRKFQILIRVLDELQGSDFAQEYSKNRWTLQLQVGEEDFEVRERIRALPKKTTTYNLYHFLLAVIDTSHILSTYATDIGPIDWAAVRVASKTLNLPVPDYYVATQEPV